jgi:hypothetical protein
MKTLLALVGLTAYLFLSGCAHDQAEATAKTTSQPPVTPPVAFTVGANGTAPLYYQWQFNGTNVGGLTVTNVSILTVTNK